MVLAAIAASSAAAGAATTTGLRGVVTRGPTTPVCRAGDSCDEPAARVTIVFSRNGAEAARTKTGLRGVYRVALPAGTYRVRVASAARIGRAITPARVRVPVGRMRTIDFTIDTGIR
jgi:hypothetical protein